MSIYAALIEAARDVCKYLDHGMIEEAKAHTQFFWEALEKRKQKEMENIARQIKNMKDKTKHTPAPWEASEHGDYSDFDGNSIVILGDDKRIVVVQGPNDEETNSNARLIAAAPELLYVAEMVLAYSTVEMPKELVDIANAAIYLATKGRYHETTI